MEKSINRVLLRIKTEFENAILSATLDSKTYQNGNLAKQALIRSQRLIGYIHEDIKNELVKNGINPNNIFPPPRTITPEIKIKGFLKSKNQDISVSPYVNLLSASKRVSVKWEEVMTINIRSQLSSLQKNIDTLYERTFAEALNLHLKYPKQVLGEVYLIPTHEYDDISMKNNKVRFKKVSKIEEYIKMFQQINDRESSGVDEYKYERVCLLISDFRKDPPKLYQTTQSLIENGLISDNRLEVEKLSYDTFVKDLLAIYSLRFNGDRLS